MDCCLDGNMAFQVMVGESDLLLANRWVTNNEQRPPQIAILNNRMETTTSRSRAMTMAWCGHLWLPGLLLLVFLLGCFRLVNVDIWVHLRTGQLMWERGEVPRTDWYTYTNPDAPWMNLHWGFQLAVAALWALSGAAGLVVAKSLAGAATVGVGVAIGKQGWPRWQTVACWLPVALAFNLRYFVRPEMLSLLLLASTIAVLYHSKTRPWLIWLLPLIQLVWVNVQGLFILQFVVLACFLIDRAWRQFGPAKHSAEGEAGDLPWPALWAAAGLTLIAAHLNPYGIHGVLVPLGLFRATSGADREFFQFFAAELDGLSDFIAKRGLAVVFSSPPWSMLALIVAGCVATFGWLAGRGRISAFRLLLFVAFCYLTWQMVRNAILLALVGGIILRLNVGDLLSLACSADGNDKGGKANAETPKLSDCLPALVAICLAALLVMVCTGFYHNTLLRDPKIRFGLGESPDYGHEAAEFLNRAGMPDHVYAMSQGRAAVCIYHICPEKRVFADARLATNTPETLRRYNEIFQQLADANPIAAEEDMRRDIAPGPDGQREYPALIINNTFVYYGSREGRQLLSNLLAGGRWRCVFFDVRPGGDPMDPDAILAGTSIFVREERAEREGLPHADLSPLMRLLKPMGEYHNQGWP